MNAPSTHARRVVLPGISDGHGNAISVPVSALVQETQLAMRSIDSARMYLRGARMRACGDVSMQYPLDVALMALREAVEAAVARVSALERAPAAGGV